jgi:hypothetical protein
MGARLKIAGGGSLVMTTVIAAILTVGGPGIDFTCDQTFNDYFLLSAAVNNTGNSGQVLCVNTDMGDQEPITITTAMPADTRVIAFPPTGTIDRARVHLHHGASNFTVEGFEFTNEKQVGIGVASNIRVVKNYAHDQKLDFVQANGAEVKSGHRDPRQPDQEDPVRRGFPARLRRLRRQPRPASSSATTSATAAADGSIERDGRLHRDQNDQRTSR